LGTLLELAAVTATGAYSIAQGYHFSSYGEAIFLSAQTAFVAAMILFFGGRAASAALFMAAYSALAYAVVTPGKTELRSMEVINFVFMPLIYKGIIHLS